MRISDWSSDVCSSDLRLHLPSPRLAFGQGLRGIAHSVLDVSDGLVQDAGHIAATAGVQAVIDAGAVPLALAARGELADDPETGRASCRVRVCQYGEHLVVTG